MPLHEAAGRVLRARFAAIERRLPAAAERPHEDIEHVHQLRVATRRARAALDLFAEALPPKQNQRLRKELRRFRRAAGAARDWDVFLANLGPEFSKARAGEAAGLHWLAGQAAAQRALAQAWLRSVHGSRFPGLAARLEQILDHVQVPETSPARLGDLAARHLVALLKDLESAAAGDLADYAHLHQVRIRGKRLRYAMEIFAEFLPSSFREDLYPRVEELQELLGAANDSHVAIQQIEAMRALAKRFWPALWKNWRAGVDRQLRRNRRHLTTQRQRFLRSWRAWHTDQVPQQFLTLLEPGTVSACAGGSIPKS